MSERRFLGWRPVWGEEKGRIYEARNFALYELGKGIDDRDWEYNPTRCRLVKVYAKKKRTAAEERADVVAWLRLHSAEHWELIAVGIEGEAHVGAAKKGSP